ncbi:MAG: hypothetical protein IIX16_07995 [Clostridia bacterium]|nr:hypothetical protein [Clostridia bacterium]
MLVNLVNNSGFKKIRVWCDGKEYFLGQRELVTVDVNRKFKLKVFTQEKNHMTFDFMFFLIDGFLDEEQLGNVVHYDAEFELEADDTEFIKTISIDWLEARDDRSFFVYYSAYLNSQNVRVLKTQYIPTDTKKQKRKSMIFLTCISSAMWLVIPLLFVAVLGGFYWLLLALIPLVLLWTIPSFKKVAKLKTGFSSDTIINTLKDKENEYNMNNGGPAPYEPSGFVEKAVDKVIRKIFKRK